MISATLRDHGEKRMDNRIPALMPDMRVFKALNEGRNEVEMISYVCQNCGSANTHVIYPGSCEIRCRDCESFGTITRRVIPLEIALLGEKAKAEALRSIMITEPERAARMAKHEMAISELATRHIKESYVNDCCLSWYTSR